MLTSDFLVLLAKGRVEFPGSILSVPHRLIPAVAQEFTEVLPVQAQVKYGLASSTPTYTGGSWKRCP